LAHDQGSVPDDFSEDAARLPLPTTEVMVGASGPSPGMPGTDFAQPENSNEAIGPEDGRHDNRALGVNAVSVPAAARPSFSFEGWALGLVALYLAGVGFFLGRWLLAYVGLWRLIRSSIAAPRGVAKLFAAMSRQQAGRPRLRMSQRLRVPVSCGLLRPTVVVPANLCESSGQARLRWIFAHELTHLRRGDVWSCLLFSIGSAAFFYCPWFWWLRRQARLCQEYVADAAAVDQDARSEDYAQFLLNLATVPAGPVLAIGVVDQTSDLFRRVTMLLQDPLRVENRCPRLWALAMTAGLLALAVLTSGLGLQAAAPAALATDEAGQAPAAPAKPVESVTDEILQRLPAIDVELRDLDTALGDLLVLDDDLGVPSTAIDALQKALDNLPQGPEMEKAREEIRKAIDRLKDRRKLAPPIVARRFAAGQPGRPGAGGTAEGFAQNRRGRLGARVEKPSAVLSDQLNLSQGQGVVINEVVPDSAAAKAGLKASDILLEIDGKAVSNDPQEFARIVDGIKADTPVDAVVLRKGKKETIKGLSLPEAARPRFRAGGGFGGLPEVPGQPGQPPAGGVPGAPGRPAAPAGPGAPALPGAPAVPNAPALPRGAPGLPRAGALAPTFPGAAAGGAGHFVMTSVMRTNDRFTTRHQEGNLIITLTGTVTGGKAKLSEIHVQDGTETGTYKSVDKVPERYRDKVKNLVEMSEKGEVKVESRSP
jgi:beta-lactamase regulating signal transducer with metallopeptidase domain